MSNVIYFYLEQEEDEPFPLLIQGNNKKSPVQYVKIPPTLLFSYHLFAC